MKSLPPNFLKSVVLAWIAAIAVDFLLNAGVFASIFSSGDSFLIPRGQAFLRIPAGYAALLFFILILGLLVYGDEGKRVLEGTRIGLLFGAATGLGLVLGLWSITVASSSFLVVWLIDQTLEMTVAGTVIASARLHVSRRTLGLIIFGAVLCLFTGVALQNLQA